jgi:ABC-type transport system substrate-binding protein
VGTAPIDLNAFVQNLTLEALAKVAPDGRVRPWLAKTWTLSADGRSLVVEIRPGVRFHDGSPVTAELVAEILRTELPRALGPMAEDLAEVSALSPTEVQIDLHAPSAFVIEALEAMIRKPASQDIGTGPFVVVPSEEPAEVRAEPRYYLGRSQIDRIVVRTYPSVRTAWAEMLRNNLDMVYEVGINALDSLETSTTIDVFTFPRNYQYVVFLNTNAPSLRRPAVRRALNAAVDREAFVRNALDGHGLPSSGPVWPRNWAAPPSLEGFALDAATATSIAAPAGRRFTFHCLASAEDELVGLALKRQLARAGIEMVLHEATLAELQEARLSGRFEAILSTVISGPSLLRTALWWYSRSSKGNGTYANPRVDAALDAIRRSLTDEDYKRGVSAFHQAIVDDPPAIFLAWNERARAVSRRFEVPTTEPNIDILGSLRLWRPAGGGRANAN